MDSLSPHTPAPQKTPFYIYALLYPESMGGHVFYIGKGQGDRIHAHEWEAHNTQRFNHKLNTIRKIQRQGEQVVKQQLAFFASEADAFLYEVALIFFMRPYGHLTNLTDGGDGPSGIVRQFSEEHRRKLSEAQSGKVRSEEHRHYLSGIRKNMVYTEVYTEEWRRKNSEAHKGRVYNQKQVGHPLSEEHRRKLSEAHKTSPRAQESRRKTAEARKGRKLPPRSEEWCRKISEGQRK